MPSISFVVAVLVDMLASFRSFRRSEPVCQFTVDRPLTAASYQECGGDPNHQKMILEAFSLLLSEPIHEESVRQMHQCDGSEHDNGQTRGGEPGEKPSQEREAAERLTDDDQQGYQPGQAHLLCEESHRPVKAESTEPAQQFLRTVRKHHEAERQPQN